MPAFSRIAATSLLLAATAASQLLNAAPLTGTVEHDTLTIGSDLTYPPYAYLEQKQPAGFDPEFMRLISHQLGTEPRFVDTRFANLVLGVNANRFDVVASALYVTPERARQVDFLGYLKTGSSLMVRSNDSFKPQRPEDLCGKRVGSIKGASWIAKLAKVSADYCAANGRAPIDSREFPTSPEAAQALLSQGVDVQFEDAAVAKIISEKLNGRVGISSPQLIYPVVVGLAVHKGNAPLLNELQSAFTAIKQNGSYATLLARYNLAEPSHQEITDALGAQ